MAILDKDMSREANQYMIVRPLTEKQKKSKWYQLEKELNSTGERYIDKRLKK